MTNRPNNIPPLPGYQNTTSENNKRIAKNTLLLYIRMFVIMAVSLFTTRVTFKILGVEDFGINNIVAGVIVLFSFINGVLNAATQRFLNYELGRGNEKSTNTVFCTSMTVYFLVVILIVILGETIGLWVFYNLNIPPERMQAAFWVYQFSILTFAANIIRIPYNATIIAYEKMDFYAYLSIIEAALKLGIVYLLMVSPVDKLISLAALNFLVSLIVLYVFKFYSNKKYPITKYRFIKDKAVFKPILSFSGWSLFGSIARIGAQQGINIVLNIFIGVTVNAAVGIGNQIASALNRFINNFQIAFRPQITKLYASGDIEGFHNLIFRASRFSYYLFLILAIPVMVCTPFLINLWLGEVPEYAVIFTRLIIIYMMIDALATPLWMAVEAIGDIKKYQIYISLINISNIPLAYLVLELGYPAHMVWVVKNIIMLAILVFRLYFIKNKFNFPALSFIQKVIAPVLLITLISTPLPAYLNYKLENWTAFITTGFVSVVLTAVAIFYIGMSKTEQQYLVNTIKEKINKQR